MLKEQTRKVEVYHKTILHGFKFFDAQNCLIFEVGDRLQEADVTPVEIGADEQIIGFKANTSQMNPSAFTGFKFMICRFY